MRWPDRSNGDFAQARRVSQLTKRYVKEGIYEIKTPSGRSGVALKGRGYAVGKNRSGSALTLGISSILRRTNAGYRESSKIVTTHTARDTQSKRDGLCSRSIGSGWRGTPRHSEWSPHHPGPSVATGAQKPPRLRNYLTYDASQSATVPIRHGPCETAIRQANEMQETVALALLLACGSAQAESIPLISEHGTFVVRVVINDRITQNFIIDGGASDLYSRRGFSTLTRAGCGND